MVWVGAEYSFASTFSYRIPYFSSSYAISAPTPSPSTVKLALVSAIINRTGNITSGEKLFESVKVCPVAFSLPKRIAVFKCFMKRLKKKRSGLGFDRTFGIREYIIYSDALKIYLDIPQEMSNLTLDALKAIQYLGSSDSICSCVKNGYLEPNWSYCPQPYENLISRQQSIEGIPFMLTDFTDAVTFDRVNPYSGKKLEEDKHMTLKTYIFPLKILIEENNCILYELSRL